MTRRTLTLLACTVAVVTAACSNGNAATIPPPRYVEKSAAIAAGDNVCKATALDQLHLIDEFKVQHPQATPDEVRDFTLDTLLPRIEQGVGDFHRIGEPTKDRLDWDTIVNGLDMDLKWFKAMTPADLMTLLSTKPYYNDWAKFDAYGFKVCGKPLA